jgi:hypothetical protein
MNERKMKIGYIRRNNQELNPNLPRFTFCESTFTRKISSRGDRVYTKLFTCPLDYEDIVEEANKMKQDPTLIIVTEPFLLDDGLKEKVVRWVEWANKADQKEYDPFCMEQES